MQKDRSLVGIVLFFLIIGSSFVSASISPYGLGPFGANLYGRGGHDPSPPLTYGECEYGAGLYGTSDRPCELVIPVQTPTTPIGRFLDDAMKFPLYWYVSLVAVFVALTGSYIFLRTQG